MSPTISARRRCGMAKPLTSAQRARALLAHLRGCETLASELLSLNTVPLLSRLTWETNLRGPLQSLISDAARTLASIEDAKAVRDAKRGAA